MSTEHRIEVELVGAGQAIVTARFLEGVAGEVMLEALARAFSSRVERPGYPSPPRPPPPSYVAIPRDHATLAPLVRAWRIADRVERVCSNEYVAAHAAMRYEVSWLGLSAGTVNRRWERWYEITHRAFERSRPVTMARYRAVRDAVLAEVDALLAREREATSATRERP